MAPCSRGLHLGDIVKDLRLHEVCFVGSTVALSLGAA